MQISARNRWNGIVEQVIPGAVNTEISVKLESGETVHSIITCHSAERLELAPGKPVIALVKASSVMLSVGETAPAIGARNVLPGKVAGVVEGPVNGEVTVDTNNGLGIAAVVTWGSVERLEICLGTPVYALFKASSVMLALPEGN